MRLTIFVLVLLLSTIAANAQALPEWYRVYTLDESTIEMNTAVVTSISKDVSRVRFRWTFNEPQSSGDVQYQSQLEVIEFNCEQKTYRPYHVTFLDSFGNIVRINESPGEWQHVSKGMMSERLFIPGCALIEKKSHPGSPPPDEKAQKEKVAQFAVDFAHDLEQAEDFTPLIDRFFVPNYLTGYLQDQNTNWFLNLNRDVASKVSRQELQRFYIAQMNASYLTSLYLISQLHSEPEDAVSAQKLLPNDVQELVTHHPYTTQYKVRDFADDKIDSVERLRSYSDLLERINSLMREHVNKVRASESEEWRDTLEDWHLYDPTVRVCGKDCLDLPDGTRLYEVNVPVFRLQLAEIEGTLKVISAIVRY